MGVLLLSPCSYQVTQVLPWLEKAFWRGKEGVVFREKRGEGVEVEGGTQDSFLGQDMRAGRKSPVGTDVWVDVTQRQSPVAGIRKIYGLARVRSISDSPRPSPDHSPSFA